jgi:uncharacterized protein (DUF362 family)
VTGPAGSPQGDPPKGDPPRGRIDRRSFLLGSAAVGLGAAVTYATWRTARDARRPWEPAAFPPPGEAHVAALAHASYDAGLEERVLDGLRAIGADIRGARVVLKPNLVEFDPGTAINTDPRLVAASVLAFRRLGASSVAVAEGPGHRRDTRYVAARSGLLEALADVGAPFVDLNVDALRPVRLRSSYTDLRELWLPTTVLDADVFVSMPKMKTHHWAGTTLSLKNCFGCVPGRVYGWPKNPLHWAGVESSILDVAAAVRPDLAIVDGIVGMEGNGPISGTPVASGLLVFGDDPVATDHVAARLMGLDPGRVPYLAEAAGFLGQGDPDRILARGEDAERLERAFALLPEFAWMRAGSAGEPAEPAEPAEGPA